MSNGEHFSVERLAYFIGVVKAIGDAGLHPGFGRVTDEDENSFTISLTIFNSIVERMTQEHPELIELANSTNAQAASRTDHDLK